MNSPTYDALTHTPILAGVSPAALALLDEEGTVRAFAARDVIVAEGGEGHSLFILMEGEVEVVKRHGGPDPFVLARLRGRTFFGEMCVVDPVPRAATVVATSVVRAIEIKAATLHHLFQKMPTQYAVVILNIARDMARRLRALDEAYAQRG